MTWKPVGAVLPRMLERARVELHWATQLVSAAGATWLPPEADFAHTNLGWDDGLGILVGRTVGDARLRAGLVFEGLELVVLEGERERATLGLAGHDLDFALGWVRDQMRPGADPPSLPQHDMPSDPVSDGAPFTEGDPHARTELAAWFSDATAAIHHAVTDESGASIVRCWPHHFDVASLIVLDAHADAEEARSIGVGFSPGDDSYDQPYFYVNPWPYPSAEALPSLGGAATWHTDRWTGAVLLGDQVIDAGEAHQARFVAKELQAAIAACHLVLSR